MNALIERFVPATRHLIIIILFCCLLPTGSLVAQDAPSKQDRVVFLPFTIEVPGQYDYLKDGLTSILASRLTAKAPIQPVTQNETTKQLSSHLREGKTEAFRQLMEQSKASYLILGSLSPKGETFELTSYVFTNIPGQSPQHFYQPLTSISEAMPAVDELAWQISGAVFSNPKPEQQAATAQDNQGISGFQTAHPERAYKEGLFHATELGLAEGGRFTLKDSRRSNKIQATVMDMNSGDIDGDGTNEILLLTDSDLLIYTTREGHFNKQSSFPLENHLRYHSISLADVNGNGISELYISGNNGDRPASSVLEWNGQKLQYLIKNINYYLVARENDKGTPVIYGQAGGVGHPTGRAFYELQLRDNATLERVKQLEIPSGFNLFDIVLADITGDGNTEIVGITRGNLLQVFNSQGSLMWSSSSIYGASSNFLGTMSSNSAAPRQPIYIHTRLVAKDIDRDGTRDILVGRNRVTSVRFMPRIRYFEGSSISALTWHQGKCAPLWETKKIPGYIVNYQLHINEETGDTSTMELLFAEAGNNGLFDFWSSTGAAINRFTIQVNREVQ